MDTNLRDSYVEYGFLSQLAMLPLVMLIYSDLKGPLAKKYIE